MALGRIEKSQEEIILFKGNTVYSRTEENVVKGS